MNGAAGWWGVARARNLRAKPMQVWLHGRPVVLFRTGGGIAAMPDRCPHRAVELSGGRVVDGAIECPYHGWRFARDGACVAIPGTIGDVPRIRNGTMKACERDGVVYLAANAPHGEPPAHPPAHPLGTQRAVTRLVTSETRSTLIDAAENILDATHTHYTHKGLLRGLSARRHRVEVQVSGGPDWVEASYTGEPQQDGFVSRLLEGGERLRTVGRFRAPGTVELEYWGRAGMVLATTFHLRPARHGHIAGIGVLTAPVGVGVPAWIMGRAKALFFRPMFALALAQDRRVLASAAANAEAFGRPTPVIGPLDVLRRDIEAIVEGRPPPAAAHPRRLEMEI